MVGIVGPVNGLALMFRRRTTVWSLKRSSPDGLVAPWIVHQVPALTALGATVLLALICGGCECRL